MHHIVRILICVVFLLVGLLTTSALAVKINTPAPDFTLTNIQGHKMTLSNYRGKLVLLNFWSTTCPPCVAEIPSLVSLHHEFKAQGLVVLGIALDPTEKPVRELIARLKVDYPTLMDSSKDVYFDSYGLFGQPVSVIVDRNGVVREKIIGGVEWTSPQMKSKIQSYLKGR